MSTRRARLVTAGLFVLVLLSFSTASAEGQTVFSTRSGASGSYELSSAAVISPDLWADYFARPAWVSSNEDVTLRVLDTGDFYVRVYGPNSYDTNWFLGPGSYAFKPSPPGNWRVTFGRVGTGFYLEDFVSVGTPPLQNVVVRLEEDVDSAVTGSLLPPEDEQPLLDQLHAAELQLLGGNNTLAVSALQSFITQVQGYVAAGTIKSALGQLWTNAANYVIQHLSVASPGEQIQILLPIVLLGALRDRSYAEL